MSAQKPLELILARNLLSSISTPAFLVDDRGTLLFYNEAAGALVGRRFEESGTMSQADWTRKYGPVGDDGEPMPVGQLPVAAALREGRPAHGTFRIRNAGGSIHDVALTAIPILGPNGSSGTIMIFWPLEEAVR
jgi:PAS domain-containing protein